MNHAQLRAFHAVASEGSFTRAAQALHVTQPTLSGQVKDLEDYYGVQLFHRRGRRVDVTDLGRHLLVITRKLFSLAQEADELLAATRGLKRGHLRLGADAPHHVMAALAAFTRRYPGISLTLEVGNSEALLQSLFEQRCDLAVVADVPADARLAAVRLRRDRLIAFIARGHPWAKRGRVAAAVLMQQRLILREPGSTTRRVFEAALARAGLRPTELLEIGTREAVREAVAVGLGAGIVADSEFGHDPRVVKLAIGGLDLTTTEYLTVLADRRELRILRAFIDIAKEAMP